MRTGRHGNAGVALAMFVLLLAALAVAFLLYGALRNGAERALDELTATQAQFKVLNEALARYVMVNKRLPCPASGNATTGLADPASATTACNSPSGVVPWSTLDLPLAAATDPWGRLYSYRVLDGTTGFTRDKGLDLSDCLDSDVTVLYALSGASSDCNGSTHENTRSDFLNGKGLTVNDHGVANAQVAYVLISHGATGLGAFLPNQTTQMSMPPSGSKEYPNASSGGTYWILDPSDASIPADNDAHFDDQVAYVAASDLVETARLGGKPWALGTALNRTTDGISSYNTGVASMKIASSGGPVMVTASADTSRNICAVSSNPEGIAPCLATVNDGNDELTTSGNETLGFDFRVERRYLKVQLADFRVAGPNTENARFTFYDGSTQVAQIDEAACNPGGNAYGQYTIDPGADFTRVEIRALDISLSSSFSVSTIAACKYNDLNCVLPSGGSDC